MEGLHRLFHPIGAYRPHPDPATAYPVCPLLRPYVSGYWGTAAPHTNQSAQDFEPSLIVPDACVDIIYTVDHSAGRVYGGYAGVSDRPSQAFPIREKRGFSRFAVQFYFWGVQFFISDSVRDSYDSFAPVDQYFAEWDTWFSEMLLRVSAFRERARLAEQFLLKRFHPRLPSPHIMNALYYILQRNGAASVRDACGYAAVSSRQMERLFHEYIGLSMKKTANLVRYQKLWRDIVCGKAADIQQAVEKYGYTDQSHLLNDFRKYHTMAPAAAVRLYRE